MTYPIHALARAVPPMTEEEFAALKADIAAQGQLEPIVLYESAVLDGIHRQRACAELGIAPRTRQYEGTAPAAFVIAMNVRRRHLSIGQQAATAEAMVRYYRTKYPTANQAGAELAKVAADLGLESVPQHSDTEKLRTTDLVARSVGVKAHAVEQFATLRKEAPDLAKEVAAGTKPLYTADAERKQAAKITAPSQNRMASKQEARNAACAALLAAARDVSKQLNALIEKYRRNCGDKKDFLAGVKDKLDRTSSTLGRFVESL